MAKSPEERAARDKEIVELSKRRDVSHRQIAERVSLTPARVEQIIRREALSGLRGQ
jgi:hypothetical protein